MLNFFIMANLSIDEFQELMQNDADEIVDEMNYTGALTELFETGSLTTSINGTNVVISITVTKE